MKVAQLSDYKEPIAECYRRIRDACLMDDVSLAEKIAAIEMVKAELMHDMLQSILEVRDE